MMFLGGEGMYLRKKKGTEQPLKKRSFHWKIPKNEKNATK